LLSWIREADAKGCLGVGFGGGEPTLYPQFARLCREVFEQTDLAVSFTTHGHWHSPTLDRELSGKVNFVRLSMDGMHEVYEANRGRSFADFERALCRISAVTRFGINYLVNDATIQQLDESVNYAIERGAQEILLLPEVPMHGRPGPAAPTIALLNRVVT
jgi:MoaA/NifB/PqqE/SkfB family radical SAM enzyme